MGGNWAWPPGWRRLREVTFARYGRICYRCGGYATTVGHAIPWLWAAQTTGST
jgi:hypothetical protein